MSDTAGLKYQFEYDLDDPRRTVLHGSIIRSKPFLNKVYKDWYKIFIQETANLPQGKIIEVGSGGGFLKEVMPEVITSDVLPSVGCDMTFSAESIPFENNSLKAILLLNVFHHIPVPEKFLAEAERCLTPGGKVIMIETANSRWSSFVYKNFHHEAFDTRASWNLTGHGPLSVSNQALPWIVFERDRNIFLTKFPALQIEYIKYHTPFRYLLSGGVSHKALLPSALYGFASTMENILSPLNRLLGMFVTISLKKV